MSVGRQPVYVAEIFVDSRSVQRVGDFQFERERELTEGEGGVRIVAEIYANGSDAKSLAAQERCRDVDHIV